MKLRVATLLIASVALFVSCDDLTLINYDLDFATAEMTIGATQVGDTTYTIISEPINPTQELEDNGISADIVKNATIKSVSMRLVSPETGNFNWAKSAKVTIMEDGQGEKEIASVDDVPDGLTTFAIETLDLDLAEYIKAGTFTFKVEATTDGPIPVDHKVILNTTFNVGI
jgi:hypothetical protein